MGYVCFVLGTGFDDATICDLAGNNPDSDAFNNDSDNCPATPQAGQPDSDADGVGDECDLCQGGGGPPFGCGAAG